MCMYTLLASQDFKIGHVLLHKPLFLALAERRLGKDVAEMWVYKGRTRLWILSAAPLLVNNSLLLVLAIACHNNSRISGIYIYISCWFRFNALSKGHDGSNCINYQIWCFWIALDWYFNVFIESRSFCVGDSFSWLGVGMPSTITCLGCSAGSRGVGSSLFLAVSGCRNIPFNRGFAGSPSRRHSTFTSTFFFASSEACSTSPEIHGTWHLDQKLWNHNHGTYIAQQNQGIMALSSKKLEQTWNHGT